MISGIIPQPGEVWAALGRLPPRQRECVLMHLYEGVPFKSIALRKKLPVGTVLRDLTRAYITLRVQLGLQDV